jgi:hypothetical protein
MDSRKKHTVAQNSNKLKKEDSGKNLRPKLMNIT